MRQADIITFVALSYLAEQAAPGAIGAALRAVSRAAENRVEANTKGGEGLASVGEAKPVPEGRDGAHVLPEAVRPNGEVEGAIGAHDGDVHGLAGGAPRVGLCHEGGFDFIVVGMRRYTLDQLCLHGVLSRSDVSELQSVMKYVRKAAASVGEA